jgi:formylglycine-generating enzyme required for sulfatase activity
MDQWDQNIYQYRSNEIENPILWNNEQSYRVLRGGSSGSFNDFCRVAYRSSFDSNTRSHIRGFRLLRSEA